MSHKILIVDDNRGCADLFKMRFEAEGWEVSITYDAEKALELLRGGYHPDVMILDLLLPKMQGDELLDIIRSDEKLKNIKVAILTALDLSKGEEDKLSDKADDYILKIEVLPGELVERITALVEKNSTKETQPA